MSDNPPINPLVPLARLVQETITVSDLVARRIWVIPPHLSVEEAETAMSEREFDAAGLILDASSVGGPTHYVLRTDLQSAIDSGKGSRKLEKFRSVHRTIESRDCVERSLPVSRLIDLFATRDRLFVLDGNHVGWIATHTELRSQAVAMAVFSYLSLMESGLKELSRSRLTDEKIYEILTEQERKAAEQVKNDLIERDVFTEYRDCLSFSAWMHVARRSTICDALEVSKRKFGDIVGALPDVRNHLAHGRGLFADRTSVTATLARVRRTIDFTHWIWTCVERESETWDRYATTEIVALDSGEVLAGEGAVYPWPSTQATYVLTAWNPGSVIRPVALNRAANMNLSERLQRMGAGVRPVDGRSPAGDWSEESFLTEGVAFEDALRLASIFSQTAFFELTVDEVRVVKTDSGEVMRTVPRVR